MKLFGRKRQAHGPTDEELVERLVTAARTKLDWEVDELVLWPLESDVFRVMAEAMVKEHREVAARNERAKELCRGSGEVPRRVQLILDALEGRDHE